MWLLLNFFQDVPVKLIVNGAADFRLVSQKNGTVSAGDAVVDPRKLASVFPKRMEKIKWDQAVKDVSPFLERRQGLSLSTLEDVRNLCENYKRVDEHLAGEHRCLFLSFSRVSSVAICHSIIKAPYNIAPLLVLYFVQFTHAVKKWEKASRA